MNKYTVGEFIYKKRKEKSLTQTRLGEMLGVSNKAVSKWETGESFPEFSLIQPLCEILGISADELVNGAERQCGGEEVKPSAQNTPPAFAEGQPADKAFEKRFFWAIGIGVFLCVLSVALLFLTQYWGLAQEYAVSVMLCVIAVAVFLFVHFGIKYDFCKYGQGNEFLTDCAKYTYILPVGIMMAIVSPCVFFVAVGIGVDMDAQTDAFLVLTVFFVWVALAVLLIVLSGMQISRLEKLYGIDRQKTETWQDRACGAVMLLATALFLLCGFVWDLWHPMWVVFPIGGILCGILDITKKKGED